MPEEVEISQDAARQMLAALRNTTTRLDELVRRLRAPNQGDVYAALAGYSAIHAAEGRAS